MAASAGFTCHWPADSPAVVLAAALPLRLAPLRTVLPPLLSSASFVVSPSLASPFLFFPLPFAMDVSSLAQATSNASTSIA